jgi:hypothetical protein
MRRAVRTVVAVGVFAAVVAMMGESLAFLLDRLDEWVEQEDASQSQTTGTRNRRRISAA